MKDLGVLGYYIPPLSPSVSYLLSRIVAVPVLACLSGLLDGLGWTEDGNDMMDTHMTPARPPPDPDPAQPVSHHPDRL